jgi:hypothetical protein
MTVGEIACAIALWGAGIGVGSIEWKKRNLRRDRLYRMLGSLS